MRMQMTDFLGPVDVVKIIGAIAHFDVGAADMTMEVIEMMEKLHLNLPVAKVYLMLDMVGIYDDKIARFYKEVCDNRPEIIMMLALAVTSDNVSPDDYIFRYTKFNPVNKEVKWRLARVIESTLQANPIKLKVLVNYNSNPMSSGGDA